tara:strand:+ start:84694 stop:84858 length:165 start_codon:yes stop_codon:yes gene_type:complete
MSRIGTTKYHPCSALVAFGAPCDDQMQTTWIVCRNAHTSNDRPDGLQSLSRQEC